MWGGGLTRIWRRCRARAGWRRRRGSRVLGPPSRTPTRSARPAAHGIKRHVSAGQLHRRPAAPAEKQEQGQKPEGRRARDAGLTEPTAAFSVSFLFAIWIASLQAGGLSKTTDARLPAAMTTPPANPSMSMLPDAPSLMSALAAAAAVPAAAGVAAAGGSLAAVAAAGEEKLRPVRAAARNAAGAERRAPTLLTLTTPPRSRGANMMAADLCNRECQTQGPGPLAGAAAGRAEEAAPGGFSASSESARLLVGPAGCGVSSHDSARDTSLLVGESLGCWSLWSFGYAAGWELYVALGGTLRGQPTSARAGAPCYTSSYHASYSRSKLMQTCSVAARHQPARRQQEFQPRLRCSWTISIIRIIS